MNTQLKRTIVVEDSIETEDYKILLDNLPTAMFLYIEDRLIFTNNKAEELSGYTKEELLNMNFWEIVHPDNREIVISRSKERLNGNSVLNEYSIKLITKTKNVKFVNLVLNCINYHGVKAILGSVEDITARIKADKKRETLFEFAPIGFFVVDVEGALINSNKETEKLFGYNKAELAGLNLFDSDLIVYEDKKKFLEMFQKSVHEEVAGPEEIRLRKFNDITIHSEIRTFPIQLREKKVVLVSVDNLSIRKRMEDEATKAMEKLQELNSLYSQFVSMVSHEFRTPLATILSSIELLQLFDDNISEDEKKGHYIKIIYAIDYLTQLLNNVININKTDSGSLELNIEKIDVAGFILNLKDEIIKNHKNQENIKFISNNDKFIVNIDKGLLKQIVFSLLEKAIKSNILNKNICLEIEYNLKDFSVIIGYEGTGIEEKATHNGCFIAGEIENISDPGLDLLLTRCMVKLLKGEMEIIDEVNMGKRFVVKFPI